jgi:hypothetical protein
MDDGGTVHETALLPHFAIHMYVSLNSKFLLWVLQQTALFPKPFADISLSVTARLEFGSLQTAHFRS